MEGKKRTDNIWLCPDGKYRWVYEFHMMKNPMILLTVLKVFGIAAAVVALFAFAIDLFDDWQITLPDPDNLKILLIVAAVFVGLIFLSYLILSGIYGWKYEVLFEMDEEGINHKQQEKHVKKSELIGAITAIAGIASGRPGVVGTGILAASRTSMLTCFDDVKELEILPKQHLIRLNETLNRNQVYAADEDFAFVADYIKTRCRNAKVKL